MRKQFIFTIIGFIVLSLTAICITSCQKEDEITTNASYIELSNKEIIEKISQTLPEYFSEKYKLYQTGKKESILSFYHNTAIENANKTINDINILRRIDKEVYGEIDHGEYNFLIEKINSLEKEGNIFTTSIKSFEKEILFDEILQEEFESSGYSEYLISFTFDEDYNIKLVNDIELNEISKRWSNSNELTTEKEINSYIQKNKKVYKRSSIDEGFNLQKKRSNRIEAVRYAIKHVYNLDNSVCDYSSGGGDCTNFVSNALHKGGKISQKSRKWFHKYSSCRNSRRIYSLSWTVADDFYRYMKRSPIMYPQSISLNNLRSGDIISFKSKKRNRAVHTAIVTKVRRSVIYVTYRNGGTASPELNRRLSLVSLKVLQTFRPRY